MSTDSRRTTIYLPKELESKLDKLKQEKFYKSSQSSMISFLINLGMEKVNEDTSNARISV